MGSKQFTGKIFDLATELEHDRHRMHDVEFHIDGPYGTPFDYFGYSHVVLVAGGIGITPCHSIFESIINIASTIDDNIERQVPNVDLIWIARDKEMFSIFERTWDKYKNIAMNKQYEFNIGCHFYFTRGTPQDVERRQIEKDGIIYYARKPNINDLLRQLLDKGIRDDVYDDETIVFCCGPNGLTKATEIAATESGAHFHSESFNFALGNCCDDCKVFLTVLVGLLLCVGVIGCLVMFVEYDVKNDG